MAPKGKHVTDRRKGKHVELVVKRSATSETCFPFRTSKKGKHGKGVDLRAARLTDAKRGRPTGDPSRAQHEVRRQVQG